MWPFKKRKGITLQEVGRQIGERQRERESQNEYAGIEDISGMGTFRFSRDCLLTIVDNKFRRHCRIGKIIPKRA